MPEQPGLFDRVQTPAAAVRQRARDLNFTLLPPRTRKENVLWELLDALVSGRREGWVTTAVICGPSVGGSEGTRRIRELRALGFAIENKRAAYVRSRWANSMQHVYRLTGVTG